MALSGRLPLRTGQLIQHYSPFKVACPVIKPHVQTRRNKQPVSLWASKDDKQPGPNSPTPSDGNEQRLLPAPSNSTDGSEQPEPNKQNVFSQLMAKLKVPAWLSNLFTDKGSYKTATVIRMLLAIGTCILVTIFRGFLITRSQAAPREVLYSTFVSLLDEGRVKTARLEGGSSRLYFYVKPAAETAADEASTASSAGTAKNAAQGTAGSATAQAASSSRLHTSFYVKLADKNDSALVSRILAANVEFGIIKASFSKVLGDAFLTSLAVWLPLMPLLFIMRKILKDRDSGSTRKKQSGAENVKTTFDDVAGVDGAKEELMEVVSVMKAAKQAYTRLNVKMPSGVLLCGPPGTGKTLLAKAVAGEAGLPFIAVSASEFVEMYVGRGAARIRELFAEARKLAPCVVFVDELDAVGSKRGMGYNDERDQTLNQLLTELDGFEGRKGVLFMAATNRIDVLDPALLRPGRLSRKVLVPLPDEPGRRDILAVHMRGVPMLSEVERALSINRMAAVTPGFSGAELANVVNEATLLAARKEQDYVTMMELLEGVRRTRNGVDGRTGAGRSGGLFGRLETALLNFAASSEDQRNVKTAMGG